MWIIWFPSACKEFPSGSAGKNLLAKAGDTGDMGSIFGSGRSPGGGHGNPLQNYCLENPMDSGAWRATVHRVTQSWTWLSGLARSACKRHVCTVCCAMLSHSVTSNSLRPMDCRPPSSSPWGSSGKNTGVNWHALLQGIFPTQGSNPCLLHSRWTLYHLSHQGSPRIWSG